MHLGIEERFAKWMLLRYYILHSLPFVPRLALDSVWTGIVVSEPTEFDFGERGCRDALGLPGRSGSAYLTVECHEEGRGLVPPPQEQVNPGRKAILCPHGSPRLFA
ncbi:MAG: hypothetical protein H5T62_02540 [Anaerolineae bacterium]|nr:hypothetical protein [Anaerolineae bacterium]